MARKIVLSLLFLGAVSITALAQDNFCWGMAPVKINGQLICQCRLHHGAGDCDCEDGSPDSPACHTTTGGWCPSYCYGEAHKQRPSDKLAAHIKQILDAHKSMVTVYIGKPCYDITAKWWLDEAVRQGKAIRFVVIPKGLKASEIEAFNAKLSATQELMLKQEMEMDKVALGSK